MAVNRGKQFEDVFQKCVEKLPDVAIIRLHDQTMGYLGARNPCDFIMYKRPYMYAIECKSTHGSSLPIYSNDPKKKYGAITNCQWESLLKLSTIRGIIAGVVCWWVEKDVTLFMPIQMLQMCYEEGWKSVNYQKALTMNDCIVIPGNKKRVFFDYSMDIFFHKAEKSRRGL